ncbi:hypothetical protein SAY86_013656 [Trapa natans]|uniref:Protein YIP n=1 Tax=Trapa natans TaxID=22666 RepID=A0AAN7KRH0_TRANT|nr:hypothetical protein SAY86_013656 [Trapa natans]
MWRQPTAFARASVVRISILRSKQKWTCELESSFTRACDFASPVESQLCCKLPPLHQWTSRLRILDFLRVTCSDRSPTNSRVHRELESRSAPGANMQIFPPNNGGDRGRGYQTLASPSETFEQQPTGNWRGVFSISSYTQYFNVDTDVVLNRLMSSLSPIDGSFFSKIDANPDLYGPIWISTTLIFVLASLGNWATYLMEKHAGKGSSWTFDVNYVNVAAIAIYGYAIVVPLGFYFLLQYLGSNANLVRFWCMWGYSLFIFILSALPLLIPVEILRWIIIVAVGAASACFVGSNLRSYVEGADVTMIVIAAFFLQMALAVFIKGLMIGFRFAIMQCSDMMTVESELRLSKPFEIGKMNLLGCQLHNRAPESCKYLSLDHFS